MNELPHAQMTFASTYFGWIFSFMGSFSLCRWDNVDFATVVARGGVLHLAGDEREQRVVLADSDVLAGEEARAALTHENGARLDLRAGELLHAEPLAGGVASVACGACALFVCHFLCLDLRDAERRLRLAVAATAALAGLVLVPEDLDLGTFAVSHDLRGDLRATEGLLAGLHVVAVRND